MKRLICVLFAVVLCMGLAMPAFAHSGAQEVQSQTTVRRDGSCSVSVTVTLQYDQAEPSPVFPVPENAQDIRLNGSSATVYTAANSQMVSLKSITGGQSGSFTFTLSYNISAVVAADEEGALLLTLQLLNAFPHPVEELSAKITLPGKIDGRPSFSSSYYRDTIEDHLGVTVAGDQITVWTTQPLKDHESLTMTLPVSAELFPDAARTARVLSAMDLIIVLTVLAAVGFYLIALRPKLSRRRPRPDTPDGICAGELGLWLTGSGMDLSMLVVSWAQLGYLRIQVDQHGRVLLHKRMDMGNERSVFENRVYHDLFGRRSVVDGTGGHYAMLCRSVRKKTPQLKNIYRSSPVAVRIFRILCALAGLLSGVLTAGAFAAHSTFLQIFLGCQFALMAWLIQEGGRHLPLRRRVPLAVAGGSAGLWLILGLWSGEWLVAVLMILFQLLAGLASAIGGQRTVLGQQAMLQILSLRKFMAKASKQELVRLLRANPGYFHELAPYALAMGMDKRFARRFAKLRLPECTYLIEGHQRQMTAAEWAAMLRSAVDKLDRRADRLFFERLTGRRR